MGTLSKITSKYFIKHSTYRAFVILELELLLLNSLELVPEVELSSLLLQLGEFVFIFRDLLQCGLDAGFKFNVLLRGQNAILHTNKEGTVIE